MVRACAISGAVKRVLIATCAAWRDLHPEDQALVACLRTELGAEVEIVVWSEARRYDAEREILVIRSVWDYQHRLAEFFQWLAELERAGVAVWNPLPVLRWNSDKRYIRELAARGFALPHTEWIDTAEAGTLAVVRQKFNGACVMKPAVSASGQNTFLVGDADDLARAVAALSGRRVLVQEYLKQVRGEGEWSLVFIGGEFSHAFRKRARGEEFRVQDEHGGENTPAAAPRGAALDTARQLLAHVSAMPLAYARVDGVMRDGQFILMELELLEPRLYPEMGEGVTRRFAAHVVNLASR